MSTAKIGRLGLAGLAAIWLFGVATTFMTDTGGTGQPRAAVPLFQHPAATGATFATLATILLIAAVFLPDRWLMRVGLVWFGAQTVHFAYHLYDIGILLPEDRFRLLSGFVVILGASAYFLWLLRRGAPEATPAADAAPGPHELTGPSENG